MSNRANYYRYGGGGGRSGISSVPDVDLFGFKERRQKRMMDYDAQIEKDLAEHAAKLKEAELKLQHDLAVKLRNNETVIKKATESGIPVDQYVSQIVSGNVDIAKQENANALKMGQMRGESLNNSDAQKASDAGTMLGLSSIPPALLFGEASPGSVRTTANIPRVNSPAGSPFDQNVLKGSTTQQKVITTGQFPATIDGKQVMLGGDTTHVNSMSQPTISRPQAPISMDEINALARPRVSATPQNEVPEDSWWNPNSAATNYAAPPPAKMQDMNGNTQRRISSTPLAPQWPPREGLVPGGYDVLGGGVKNLFDLYRSNVSNPLWRLLFGNGQ